ncbi:hypothetical protein ACPCTG_32120 [Streptomyces pseudogriseolus]|uniref:hypothetical protein n=1 Tax=Streptomyces pseudogriseolus TaxID=36817 RepID=UPI003FA324FD
MSNIPATTPASSDGQDGFDDEGFETMRADAVLTGRAMSSGEYLAGLIASGQLATVGRPDKLAVDLFPEVDPVVVQTIWDRALAVGLYAGRRSVLGRQHRDELDRIAGELQTASFHAMGQSARRSRRLVAPDVPSHPADGEQGLGH